MTTGEVWDRIRAIVEAQGYYRSLQPFDLDNQPDTVMENAFHMLSERAGSINLVGGGTIPQHQFTIFLAQKTKRDPWGAARQLKVDLDLLLTTITNDFPAYDYVVMDEPRPTSECLPPGPEKDFVVGRLTLTVDFDS